MRKRQPPAPPAEEVPSIEQRILRLQNETGAAFVSVRCSTTTSAGQFTLHWDVLATIPGEDDRQLCSYTGWSLDKAITTAEHALTLARLAAALPPVQEPADA